jgi:hypothetical protein
MMKGYPVKHRKIFSGAALALFTLFLTAPTGTAQARVEAGVLRCHATGGTHLIFGSTKSLSCVFRRRGKDEHYVGNIARFGIDVGVTTRSAIVWAVLAPTADVPRGALEGEYSGVSGEATVGVGVGANALIGASDKSVVLQPVSFQAQEGLNVAAGIATLRLRLAR